MKTRKELLSEISNSKKAKLVALISAIISISAYLFFDTKQVNAEKELLILDQGRLDEMVLGE